MNIFNFNDKDGMFSLDISWGAIFKVVVAVFLVYFLYLIKDILFWVLSGIIISVLFNPAIGFFQKLRISRGLATAFVYSMVFGALFFLVYAVTPVFKHEIAQISIGFPHYFERVAPVFSGMGIDAFQSADTFFGALRGWLMKLSTTNIFDSVTAIFGGLFLAITVLSLAVFFSLEEKGIENAIKTILPKKHEVFFINAWNRTQTKISGWFAARLLSMLFVGVTVALLCAVVGVDYPIFFGTFAFIVDIIPFIGPIFYGAVIALFALLDAWQKAAAIAIGIFIINQIEGNIITPVLTKKFMNFPATLVLISLLVGERLWGIMGAVLAIPLFGIVYDFTRDFLEKNKD
jgi:predicted PurR-regulated permease PerM